MFSILRFFNLPIFHKSEPQKNADQSLVTEKVYPMVIAHNPYLILEPSSRSWCQRKDPALVYNTG